MTLHTSESLEEQAALWSERLREQAGDAKLRQTFELWRDADPAHAAAFERVEFTRAAIQAMAESPELQALRQQTRARTAPLAKPNWRRPAAIAASLVLLLGGLWLAQPMWNNPGAGQGKTYSTATGERLVATLDDGSVLKLNTNTRATVHFNEGTRAITLERGQALFEVAHNKSRPFIVTAGQETITALGTAFDINLDRKNTTVTLIKGRVRVANQAYKAVLEPGQQYLARTGQRPLIRVIDTPQITSWTNGQIIFENTPLADAVAEMNRYANRKTILADSKLASLRISGSFESSQPSVFIEALTQYFPIDVEKQDTEHTILALRK